MARSVACSFTASAHAAKDGVRAVVATRQSLMCSITGERLTQPVTCKHGAVAVEKASSSSASTCINPAAAAVAATAAAAAVSSTDMVADDDDVEDLYADADADVEDLYADADADADDPARLQFPTAGAVFERSLHERARVRGEDLVPNRRIARLLLAAAPHRTDVLALPSPPRRQRKKKDDDAEGGTAVPVLRRGPGGRSWRTSGA